MTLEVWLGPFSIESEKIDPGATLILNLKGDQKFYHEMLSFREAHGLSRSTCKAQRVCRARCMSVGILTRWKLLCTAVMDVRISVANNRI